MLTDAQFHLRILEGILTQNSVRNDSWLLFDTDELREYMEKKFGVAPDDQDQAEDANGYKKHLDAVTQIDHTLQGFLKTLGEKVGIEMKFSSGGDGF